MSALWLCLRLCQFKISWDTLALRLRHFIILTKTVWEPSTIHLLGTKISLVSMSKRFRAGVWVCSNVLLIRVLAHLRPDCNLSLSATQSGFSPIRQDQSGKFGCLVLSGQETHMLSPVEPYYHFYYKMCFPTSDDCAVGTQQIPVHDSRKLSRETKTFFLPAKKSCNSYFKSWCIS